MYLYSANCVQLPQCSFIFSHSGTWDRSINRKINKNKCSTMYTFNSSEVNNLINFKWPSLCIYPISLSLSDHKHVHIYSVLYPDKLPTDSSKVWRKIVFILVGDCCLMSNESFFSYIMITTSYTWWDNVYFVLDWHTLARFLNWTDCRYMRICHSTLCTYSMKWCVLSGETTNSNFIVFGLTELMIYGNPSKHTNQYSIDVVLILVLL